MEVCKKLTSKVSRFPAEADSLFASARCLSTQLALTASLRVVNFNGTSAASR
jgi:hypothetical protein